jgi:glutathione S-transferase
VGAGPTLADICLFPYTHVAEDGLFVLADYPSVQAWIERVKSLPGFIPLDA